MNSDLFLRVHEQCRLVSGYNRGIIYDLGREAFHFVPNELVYFLRACDGMKLSEIEKNANTEEKEYLDYCIRMEFAFKVDEDELVLFPYLSLKWEESVQVNNAIVEIDGGQENAGWNKIFDVFNALGVKFLEIRLLNYDKLAELEKLLEILNESCIFSIQIKLKGEIGLITKEQLDYIKDRFRKVIEYKGNEIASEKNGSTDAFEGLYHRILHMKRGFSSNIKLYSESVSYNTYFNRKIFIGANGELKNAPELKQSYGVLWDLSLREVKDIVNCKDFQKYWAITKKNINVCSDCEFRYMCVDRRIPKKCNNDWYFERECFYNPYISKWRNEEGFLSLNDCGVQNNEQGLLIDEKKVKEIITKLWPN